MNKIHDHKVLSLLQSTAVISLATIMNLSASTLKAEIKLSGKKWNPNSSFFIKPYDINHILIEQQLPYREPANGHVKPTDTKRSPESNQAVLKRIKYVQRIDLIGRVINERGYPMLSASIKIEGSKLTTRTDIDGMFYFKDVDPAGKLIVSNIGYRTDTIAISGKRNITIKLDPQTNQIEVVDIVSTGYQDIPKERATGSFEVITKEQLQHSNDPNLLRRLEGITTSLDFRNDLRSNNSASSNARQSILANLTVRGKNTLNEASNADLNGNTSGQVLVVIDGIASPYSIDKVNPNDVESITILKDAAAASIWGSRAANGVLVIKTKRGGYDRKSRITFNSNFNVAEKVDLFYIKSMSVSDYIDAQASYFEHQNRPLPDLSITSLYNQEVRSPVVEIIDAWKFKHTLTDAQAKMQLDALKANDIRNDYQKYFVRNAVTQSYAIGFDGGNEKLNYRLSGGLDKSINNTKNSDINRIALGYAMGIKPTERLELQGNISYNVQKNNDQAPLNRISGATDATFYPYSRLVDDNGKYLELAKTYRQGFPSAVQDAYGDGFLSYRYVPLQDINEGYNKLNSQNININFSANYKIVEGLSTVLSYNYNGGRNNENTLYRQNSFYMRDLINYFTTSPSSVDPMTFEPVGPYRRQLPLGGQYSTLLTTSNNQTVRGQLNFDHLWKEKHQVSAIAGFDIAQSYSLVKNDGFYGYNENTLYTDNKLDYKSMIPIAFSEDFSGYNGSYIPNLSTGFVDNKVRTLSYYSNIAYTFDSKYTISGSFRKDLSSEFGRGTNQKGTPYYSVGGSWNIHKENFYHWELIPSLTLRTTFGYNGNVNPSVIARALITYNFENNQFTNLPFAYTTFGSATNYLLRPEKTAIFNVGLDFITKGNILSGNIQYYRKNTTDLISNGTLDPSTGYTNINFNTGNITGNGVELTLNSTNLKLDKFSWNSNFLLAYNRVKVTKLYSDVTSQAGSAVDNSSGSYNVGYDLSRLFAYKWAGLDPKTGDPRGYINGLPVSISNSLVGDNNYRDIQNQDMSTLEYFGSAVPVYYGSFRNSFNYGAFSLSANFLYKLGYFVRRPRTQVIDYQALYSGNSLQPIEYNDRWQKQGDESRTNVPSAVESTNNNRDKFYYYSSVNVLKGDHVRLQEINLSYRFNVKSTSFIKDPKIHANINNLGIVWKANHVGVDPEVFDYKLPRTYSVGFSANF